MGCCCSELPPPETEQKAEPAPHREPEFWGAYMPLMGEPTGALASGLPPSPRAQAMDRQEPSGSVDDDGWAAAVAEGSTAMVRRALAAATEKVVAERVAADKAVEMRKRSVEYGVVSEARARRGSDAMRSMEAVFAAATRAVEEAEQETANQVAEQMSFEAAAAEGSAAMVRRVLAAAVEVGAAARAEAALAAASENASAAETEVPERAGRRGTVIESFTDFVSTVGQTVGDALVSFRGPRPSGAPQTS